MADNLFAGVPHSGTGLQTKAFSQIPAISAASIAIIYKVGSPLKSYVPGRSINAISGFEKDAGYYIIPKQNLDLSAFVTPPVTGCLMQLPLTNFEGDTDLAYPLGVFSNAGTYLGIATDPASYIALWNADEDNQELGQIVSGTGTTFEVKPAFANTVIALYALEFYQFTSSASSPVVHVDEGDLVLHGSTITPGSSGTLTLSSTVNEYNGTWGINAQPAFTFRKVATTAPAGQPIRVFHSRRSRYIGMDAVTPYTSLTGILPAHAKTFSVRGSASIDFTQIGNWDDLQELEFYSIMNIGGSPYSLNNPGFYPQPPASLIGICLHDMNDPADMEDLGWLTAANFPNLRFAKLAALQQDLLGNNKEWFADMPPVKEQIIVTGTATSAANADEVINNLWTALQNVVPEGVKSIRLSNASARTSASDTAFNALVAAGWTIQLT